MRRLPFSTVINQLQEGNTFLLFFMFMLLRVLEIELNRTEDHLSAEQRDQMVLSAAPALRCEPLELAMVAADARRLWVRPR